MVEMKMESNCHEDEVGDGGMVNLWKRRRGWWEARFEAEGELR
jgi:hypothetical protein